MSAESNPKLRHAAQSLAYCLTEVGAGVRFESSDLLSEATAIVEDIYEAAVEQARRDINALASDHNLV